MLKTEQHIKQGGAALQSDLLCHAYSARCFRSDYNPAASTVRITVSALPPGALSKCTAFNQDSSHHALAKALAEAVAPVQEVTSAKQRMEDAMQRVRSLLPCTPALRYSSIVLCCIT